jgi:hypothetical protein
MRNISKRELCAREGRRGASVMLMREKIDSHVPEKQERSAFDGRLRPGSASPRKQHDTFDSFGKCGQKWNMPIRMALRLLEAPMIHTWTDELLCAYGEAPSALAFVSDSWFGDGGLPPERTQVS